MIEQTELTPAQVIGQHLSEIRQISKLNNDGLDWTTSYFVLKSGISFVLPDEMASGLSVERVPVEAVRSEGVAAITGQRIATLLKPKRGAKLPFPNESLFLLFESGVLVADVMGGYTGTASAGIYLHAEAIDFNQLEVVWGELPQM